MIETTNIKNFFTGNDTTKQFSYAFYLPIKSYLKVVITGQGIEQELVLDSDYLVNLNANSIELVKKTVPYLTDISGNLKSGYTIMLKRYLQIVQQTSLRNQSQYFPGSIESALDYSRMIDLQLQDQLSRVIKASDHPGSFNFTIPSGIIGKPGQVIITNHNGDGFTFRDLPIGGGSGASHFIDLLDTPNHFEPGKYLKATASGLTFSDIVIPQVNFLTLPDTPNSYTGKAGKILAVNQAEDKLELIDPPSSGGTQSAGIVAQIIMSASPLNDVPTGFLYCNGQEVSRTTYDKLFQAIGSSYGHGDDSTTFNVPDMRGAFVRGWDDGKNRDPEANSRVASGIGGQTGNHVGTLQLDRFKTHDHSASTSVSHKMERPRSHTLAGTTTVGTQDKEDGSSQVNIPGFHSSASTTVHSRGGLETRPVNIALKYFIRF